jgi:hypothetical protein
VVQPNSIVTAGRWSGQIFVANSFALSEEAKVWPSTGQMTGPLNL